MKKQLRLLFAALAIVALPVLAIAAGDPPAGWPTNLRWDLVPKWIAWDGAKATITWPPNDGCAAAPVTEVVPTGTLIDRFGSEGGTFFSPKGESFKSRAVPYVCKAMDYRVYKVLQPLTVKGCKAAPWFDEPGGAKQVQTADPAYKLVAAGTIVAETYVVGGSNSPMPQCRNP